GRTTGEQSRRLGLRHNFTQGGAAGLASSRIERTRHFGGLDRLGDRQSKYRNDRRIAYFVDELLPERNQQPRQGFSIVQGGQLGGYVKSLGALADASNQHFLFIAD